MSGKRGFGRKTNTVDIRGNVAFVDVSTKKHPNTFAIIDAKDIPLVIDGNGRWIASLVKEGYTLRVQRGSYNDDGARTSEWLHIKIFNPEPGEWVDHKNGDGLDNTRSNLRDCTPQQNQGNRTKNRNGKCAYKGVTQNEHGHWLGQLHFNGKHIHLGRFDSAEEAARAYDAAAVKHFGMFARTNFGSEA